jgi:hypothetical protein
MPGSFKRLPPEPGHKIYPYLLRGMEIVRPNQRPGRRSDHELKLVKRQMYGRVIVSSGSDPDNEVIPPVPETAKTRPGDIWILGEHRVGCGDGRDAGFLQRVLGDGTRADAAFLDPPYNVRIGGHAVAAGSHREFAMASGEMGEAEFRTFLADTFGSARHGTRLNRVGNDLLIHRLARVSTSARRNAQQALSSRLCR